MLGEQKASPADLHCVGSGIELLFAPRKAASVATSAPAWIPLVLLAASAAFANYPTLFRLGARDFLQARLEATPDGMYPVAMTLFLFMTVLWPLVLPLATWLTGLSMDFYLRYILGARMKDKQAMRLTVYGLLPLGFQQLLIGSVRLLGGDTENLFNPLATNLAFGLNPKTTTVFWYEFARGADVSTDDDLNSLPQNKKRCSGTRNIVHSLHRPFRNSLQGAPFYNAFLIVPMHDRSSLCGCIRAREPLAAKKKAVSPGHVCNIVRLLILTRSRGNGRRTGEAPQIDWATTEAHI
jgi:hypothetical protein